MAFLYSRMLIERTVIKGRVIRLLAACLVLSLLIEIVSCTDTDNRYSKGKQEYTDGNLMEAKSLVRDITPESEFYDSAQILLAKIDSSEQYELKESLKTLIEEISNFKGSKTVSSLEEVLAKVVTFRLYAAMIVAAEGSEDEEIKSLGKKLGVKVSSLQRRELPRLRKLYASYMDTKLWKYDIDVVVKGGNYNTIEFVGGLFAANKNILDFHVSILETIKDLRFTRINYKWYEYDDEYTYYKISSKKIRNFIY